VNAGLSDTHPNIEQIQIEIIRRMPSWKKMAIVSDLNQTVALLAVSGIRARHPDASQEQVKRLLAEMMLGSDLAVKVYGNAE
jgi:hypothetical protein